MPTTVTATTTETLTELLMHLVRMPTVSSDPATNRAAMDWIENQLAGLPLTIKRLQHNGVPSLVATTPAVRNPKAPKLWLAAHTDVVAAEPADFETRATDGRIYGRGTHDMKYAIAVYIALLQALGSELERYDLGLLLTADEEIGGRNGVNWLVNDLGYRGGAVLLPDSSTPWQIATACKGIMRWQLEATGHAAHASRPWQGVNAIDELVKFVNHIRTNVPTEPCGDPKHYHATANLGIISGGAVANQVPGTAVASLDIRFPPELSPADITAWFDAAHLAVPTVRATDSVASPAFTIPASAAATAFEALAREITGREILHHTAHGSSDARYFAPHGVPVIDIGITGSGYHTSPEWVDQADLTQFYELTRRFVDEFALV